MNTKVTLSLLLREIGKVNEEIILLLKSMCKDKEIKNTLSHLIVGDLVEKFAEQENEIKFGDIVNAFHGNTVINRIFPKENKKHILFFLRMKMIYIMFI